MTELLIGGGIGTVLGALAMGFFLWRERDKRSTAEALATYEAERADREVKKASAYAAIAATKETRIHELEVQLAAVDPGAVLDLVFKPRKPSTPP